MLLEEVEVAAVGAPGAPPSAPSSLEPGGSRRRRGRSALLLAAPQALPAASAVAAAAVAAAAVYGSASQAYECCSGGYTGGYVGPGKAVGTWSEFEAPQLYNWGLGQAGSPRIRAAGVARPASAAAGYGDMRPGGGASGSSGRGSRQGVDEQVAETHAVIAGIQGQSEWSGAALHELHHIQVARRGPLTLNSPLPPPTPPPSDPALQSPPSRAAWRTLLWRRRRGGWRLAAWRGAWTSWSSQTAAWCVLCWGQEEGEEEGG